MNQFQPLANLVAVSAWYSAGDDPLEMRVHVDVTFGKDAFGTSQNDALTFSLSLRAASVIVVVPGQEGIRVVPSSVAMDDDTPELSQRFRVEKVSSSEASVTGGIAVDEKGIAPSLKAALSRKSSRTVTAATELQRTGRLMSVVHHPTSEGNHRWHITTAADVPLIGKPWNAKKSPRLTVRRAKALKAKELTPTVLIEVQCRPGDLRISKPEIRNKAAYKELLRASGSRNRIVAAECAIRDAIAKGGFQISGPRLPGNVQLVFVACNEFGT